MLRLPSWWLEVMEATLGKERIGPKGRKELLLALTDMGERFTAEERPASLHAGYDRGAWVAAYLLYYGTVNALKVRFPLREWARTRAPMTAPSLSVLELGAGPGTGLLGLACLLEDEPALVNRILSWEAIDRSTRNLSLSRRLAEALGPRLGEVRITWTPRDILDAGSGAGTHDLVLAMNLLNELPQARESTILGIAENALKQDGVLILIEPALRWTSRRLLRLRDQALGVGWSVLSPCTRQSQCPALEKDRDWCHHEEFWERPSLLAELDQALGRVKLSLKYSYLILSRTPTPVAFPDQVYRVVSERFDEKGRTRLVLCGMHGRAMTRCNHRDRHPDTEAFFRADRYDLLHLPLVHRDGEEWSLTHVPFSHSES